MQRVLREALPRAAQVRASLGAETGPTASLLMERALARSRAQSEFGVLLTATLPNGVRSSRWQALPMKG